MAAAPFPQSVEFRYFGDPLGLSLGRDCSALSFYREYARRLRCSAAASDYRVRQLSQHEVHRTDPTDHRLALRLFVSGSLPQLDTRPAGYCSAATDDGPRFRTFHVLYGDRPGYHAIGPARSDRLWDFGRPRLRASCHVARRFRPVLRVSRRHHGSRSTDASGRMASRHRKTWRRGRRRADTGLAVRPAIAVVGMACRYADADTPEALWETVLARRRTFRQLPQERLRLTDYAPREKGDPDGLYPIEAAVLENYAFDRARHRIPAAAFAAADLTHWLALEVASEALADAGFSGGGDRRERTAVIVGNTLTGEFSRTGLLRLRWPYVRRKLAAALLDEKFDQARCVAFLDRFEQAYKEPFPPPDEESLAGGLSNTIAGRICNYHDLHGGG